MAFKSSLGSGMAVVAGVAGLGYLAAERFGPGDCAGAVFGGGSVVQECFGLGNGGATAEIGEGPEVLSAKLVDRSIFLTFGEVEVEMVYARDSDSGDLTKVDWDAEGITDFAGDVDGTRFVKDKPFVVTYTPCAKLGTDYEQVQVGVDVSLSEEEKQSVFELEYLHEDPNDQLKITGIVAHTDALLPCAVRVPTTRADGTVNDIERYTDGRVNNGVAETFDYITEDLAIRKAAASACPAELLDMASVRENIAKFVAGAIMVEQPQLAGVPVTVEVADQSEVQQHYADEYAAKIDEYKSLEETIIGDSDGNHKDIKVKFSDKMVEVTACGGI